jgi:DNA (cytosine-5)-methyltransferase 1
MADWLTASDAASYLGCSEQNVRKLIRNGRIPASRHGKSWKIAEDGLADYSAKGGVISTGVSDHPRRGGTKGKIRALSFFSGALGLDLGLERAGIEVLLACEMEKACRETIALNKPEMALIGDITKYPAAEIRKHAGLSPKEEIDLVVGGPPCQAFSTAGKRQGFSDDRGNVFLTFVDRILELRPRYAVIENVRGLLSAPLDHRPHERRGFGFPPLTPEEEKGGALDYILSKLKAGGYGISFNLYNSANFGAPQVRERVVLVCSRDGSKAPYLTPTHSENGDWDLPKWRTVRQVLRGFGKIEHQHVKFPEKRLKYYRMLKAGQYWKHLPEKLQKEAMGASYYAGGGKTGFYRRVAWDKPSPTLVTHPAMPATDLCHPEEDRPLSIQEYKRIQEFPDHWTLAGSLTDQYMQAGNAVPCSLGAAIGRLILELSSGKKPPVFSGFPYSRYCGTDDQSWETEVRRKTQIAAEQMALAIA